MKGWTIMNYTILLQAACTLSVCVGCPQSIQLGALSAAAIMQHVLGYCLEVLE